MLYIKIAVIWYSVLVIVVSVKSFSIFMPISIIINCLTKVSISQRPISYGETNHTCKSLIHLAR